MPGAITAKYQHATDSFMISSIMIYRTTLMDHSSTSFQFRPATRRRGVDSLRSPLGPRRAAPHFSFAAAPTRASFTLA